MDLYATLELKYGATHDEIKKAFHRLAKIHHPDKGGNVKKFQEINNAYQTLIKQPVPTQQRQRDNPGNRSYNPYGNQNEYNPFQGYQENFEEIFSRYQSGTYKQAQQTQSDLNNAHLEYQRALAELARAQQRANDALRKYEQALRNKSYGNGGFTDQFR